MCKSLACVSKIEISHSFHGVANIISLHEIEHLSLLVNVTLISLFTIIVLLATRMCGYTFYGYRHTGELPFRDSRSRRSMDLRCTPSQLQPDRHVVYNYDRSRSDVLDLHLISALFFNSIGDVTGGRLEAVIIANGVYNGVTVATPPHSGRCGFPLRDVTVNPRIAEVIR